ncbi:aminodeoxychorismate lyase [Halorubellus sp. JP-L1]|uniref:aminotransferase class IV n=1 Tax=Halorubellus sp. JP-L1 TaxID=2715753 RepID=UPI00140960D1|nr:aminodeoxychorismate lyase [Halorubellus sp. JP-L1]
MQYHVDGALVDASEAAVSVDDRGFQYGDGVFETMRAYGGDVFAFDAHLDRLERSCDAIGLDHGLGREDLRERVVETLAANDLEDAYAKLSMTRGSQPGTVTPRPDVDPTVVVYAKPLPRGGLDGESVWDAPAVLQTAKTRKPPANALPPGAKTHNYLNSILARDELVADADEALLRDQDDRVAEGAASNVFWVDDDGLHTPAADLDLLPGITRSVVLDLAREQAGVPVHTGEYALDAVRAADECFLTNSTWELRPVASVDGIDVGGGPVTDLLARLYDRLVEQRHYGADGGGDADETTTADDGTGDVVDRGDAEGS